jgi:diguanylate cyclase (GGDEF)-like protein
MDEFLRRLRLPAGDIPTTEELERLGEERRRVELVIRARWALLAIMALFGGLAIVFFQHSSASAADIPLYQKLVPFGAFLFVAGYNAWVGYALKWLVGIRGFNKVQLLVDLLFVTVLVHYSGGAVSWFWTIYLVLTLEAALIMERRGDAFLIAAAGSMAYGALLTAEYYAVLRPVPMPYYAGTTLQHNFSYEMIKWAWMSITNICVAWVGSYMMDSVRQREAQLHDLVNKDSLTSLYNRRHFFLRLNSEIQRARRYGRTFSLLIIDVDHFKRYNDSFGHPAGDHLLKGLAEIMLAGIRRSDMKPTYEVDIGCRYGGEEFAIILPEAASVQGEVAAERIRASIETRGALVVAERIRQQIEKSRWEGRGVTVSIGVASFPEHGADLETLLKAADDALYEAKAHGRNRVVVAASGRLDQREDNGRG